MDNQEKYIQELLKTISEQESHISCLLDKTREQRIYIDTHLKVIVEQNKVIISLIIRVVISLSIYYLIKRYV